MKSKNIPADIKSKSLEDAQNEIKDIISGLENSEISSQDAFDKYQRMIQLNHYIREKFKKKSVEINEINGIKFDKKKNL
jgi:exonuclease VII small subunit